MKVNDSSNANCMSPVSAMKQNDSLYHSNEMSPEKKLHFVKSRHIKYFQRCLKILPFTTAVYDTSRMTVLFFTLSGLDLLNSLHVVNEDKSKIIDWIYSLQVLPTNDNSKYDGGFRGGASLMNICTDENCSKTSVEELNSAHIAMTYTALTSLVILGDSLSRVNRKAINAHIASLQCPDGSFYSTCGGSENDMRFVYCAASICYILQDFSALNIDATVKYILTSRSFEGGLGQGPFQEAHGGPTYCGIAALELMGKIDEIPMQQRQNMIHWLVMKQDSLVGGLKGRPNKPADTCYSFWVGATLKLLGAYDFVNEELLLQFVLSAQDPITGGLGKYAEVGADGLHSYLGISGLSLMANTRLEELQLEPVDPSLNISQRALKYLHELHKSWSS